MWRPQPRDTIGFVFGVGFVAMAGALCSGAIAVDSPGLRWLAAAILLVLGVVMLMVERSRE